MTKRITVAYERLFATRKYENEKIGVSITVDVPDDQKALVIADTLLAGLRVWVDKNAPEYEQEP